MTMQKIGTDEVNKHIDDHSKPCLVMFSRQDCPVCQEVMLKMEDIAPRYAAKFAFYYVDVEEDKSILKKYFLKGVPQLLFFKDSELSGKLSGGVEEEEIEAMIAGLISEV